MNMIRLIATTVSSWVKKVIALPTRSAAKVAHLSNETSYSYTMSFAVKVIRCSDSLFWYRKNIGQVFRVEYESADRFWVREDDEWRCLNFILKKDSEIVHTK